MSAPAPRSWTVRKPSPDHPHSIEVHGPEGNWVIRATERKSGASRGSSPRWDGWRNEIADAELIAAAPETAAERDRLKAINAALLAALEETLYAHAGCDYNGCWCDQARAAIRRARGEE